MIYMNFVHIQTKQTPVYLSSLSARVCTSYKTLPYLSTKMWLDKQPGM